MTTHELDNHVKKVLELKTQVTRRPAVSKTECDSSRLGSNQGPSVCETDVLTTTPCAHKSYRDVDKNRVKGMVLKY